VSEDDLYQTIDWLAEHQGRIEKRLAAKHLRDGTLVLYDVSSSYFEGRTCPLARFGYNRDGKKGKTQIVYGLLCAKDGCPVAIEVFDGNTSDTATVQKQIEKLKNKFALQHVVLVGDRGMITAKGIEERLRPAGIDWLTSLRANSIQKLAGSGELQLSLFDERDIGEITSKDYPNERLIVCRNPALAEERSRKRIELLEATEKNLKKIAEAVHRKVRPVRGKDKIALKVGQVLDKHKVGKHFTTIIEEDDFTFERNEESIREEAALDGFYILRTPVPKETLETNEVVKAYKSLSLVERAFRCMKSIDLQVRPIHHRLEKRVRGHVFLCMLAYYTEWHMQEALAPILFSDHHRKEVKDARPSPVTKAVRSEAAMAKDRKKHNEENDPVTTFAGCLATLATLCRNLVKFNDKSETTITKLTTPTPFQIRAFELLGVKMSV